MAAGAAVHRELRLHARVLFVAARAGLVAGHHRIAGLGVALVAIDARHVAAGLRLHRADAGGHRLRE